MSWTAAAVAGLLASSLANLGCARSGCVCSESGVRECGQASSSAAWPEDPPPSSVTTVASVTGASKVAASDAQACVVRRDGRVVCWRGNAAPRQIEGLEQIEDLVVGDELACARDGVGSVHCWSDENVLRDVFSEARLLVLGGDRVCAVGLEAARLRCQTLVFEGAQLRGAQPLAAPTLVGVTALSMTKKHACAVLSDGNVMCWDVAAPARVARIEDLPAASDVSVGDGHRCARTRDAQIHCWGANEHGQLGDGGLSPRDRPHRVEGVAGSIGITAAGATTCAKMGGVLACWGRGARADRCKQKRVLGVEGIDQFALTPSGSITWVQPDKVVSLPGW